MQLMFKGQAWYLWGFCRIRQGFRTFRISRMKDLYVTGESFGRKSADDANQNETPESVKHPIKLKLRFQPDVLFRLYDDYDKDRIIENRDGTCEITVTYPEDEWVYGHIMSFGSSVEVIEPEHIRRIIKEKMEATLKYYRE